MPRNPLPDDEDETIDPAVVPAGSDEAADQLPLFEFDEQDPSSPEGVDDVEDAEALAVAPQTGGDEVPTEPLSQSETEAGLPPATSIEVLPPPKPASKGKRRSEAAELARLRDELPAEQSVFALFAGAKSTPAQLHKTESAKAEPEIKVEEAESDVAALSSDDKGERPTPPTSKYTPEQILALREAVYKRTQHYTMMSSMLHMRSPIPLRSKLSVLAATLPQSDEAEVARIEPRKLTPQSRHSERQSIVVLEPDHFIRYVLTADNSAVEHVMDRVEIDDEMRRFYIEPRKMQEITKRIAEVGPLSVPEV